jgi:hypothetical protein
MMAQPIPTPGIPGTISPKVARLRWIRQADFHDTRAYRADTADGYLLALVSRDAAGEGGKLLWHLSVSHKNGGGQFDRLPSWDELKHAAYRLVPADVPFVLIFPRRSTPAEAYVNIAETCLHLWESTEARIDQ